MLINRFYEGVYFKVFVILRNIVIKDCYES